MDPVQPVHPEWGSVACVEVVLCHFGCPLSRVVIGVELSGGHHALLRLVFLRRWRLKAQRDQTVSGGGTSCHWTGRDSQFLRDFDPQVSLSYGTVGFFSPRETSSNQRSPKEGITGGQLEIIIKKIKLTF